MRQERFLFRSFGGWGSAIMASVVLVGLLVLFFWIAKGVFQLLTYATPVMIIAALIIRHQVVVEFFKWIWGVLQREPLVGILYVLLAAVGFPLVAAYLLFKAIASKRLERIRRHMESGPPMEYTEYEVIEDHYLDINSEEDIEKYQRRFDQK